jgi:peroxiredoxin
MRWVVLAGMAALALALGVMFLRALPTAVERQKSGRDAAERAVCVAALNPDWQNPALGPLRSSGPSAEGGVDAPDFKLKDYAGREIQLSSLRGRVVLVNFWATWCQTCVVEMPSLDQLAAAEKGKPFTLLAVSVDENWDVVRNFFAQGTTLTVLLDPDKSVPPKYGTDKFPESFLIDRDGKVRYYVISDRNWASPDVKACIDKLIAG